MKAVTVRRGLVYCGAVVIAHSVLLIFVQRTGVVEKMMAGAFSRWELAVIVAFIGCRLVTYLVVPPVLAGMAAHRVLRRMSGRR